MGPVLRCPSNLPPVCPRGKLSPGADQVALRLLFPAKSRRGADGNGASLVGAARSLVASPFLWSRVFMDAPTGAWHTSPRATPWGQFDNQPVRSEETPQRGGWGQRAPRAARVGRGVPSERGDQGAWLNPGPCPGLVCGAPLGQRRGHWGGHWRWDNDKASGSNSLLRGNLRKSCSGGQPRRHGLAKAASPAPACKPGFTAAERALRPSRPRGLCRGGPGSS